MQSLQLPIGGSIGSGWSAWSKVGGHQALCATFVRWTGWTLTVAMHCYDDSTINIVVAITITITMIKWDCGVCIPVTMDRWKAAVVVERLIVVAWRPSAVHRHAADTSCQHYERDQQWMCSQHHTLDPPPPATNAAADDTLPSSPATGKHITSEWSRCYWLFG